MSNFGPPGGPPGRGRDPHEEPYTEPSDPWGDWGRDNNESAPEQQGYDQGGYGGGYGQQQGYGGGNYDVTGTGYAQRPAEAAPGGWNPAPGQAPYQPPQQAQPGQPLPPAKKGSGGMIALVAILVVLVLAGGGGAAYYLLNQDGDGNEASGDPVPSASASAAPSPTSSAAPTPSATAAVSDARDVKKGECVQNTGSEGKPVLKVAECDQKNVYEVLDRFDQPAAGEEDAQKKCADVEGYTNYYFFNSQLDSLDFVLCLKQR